MGQIIADRLKQIRDTIADACARAHRSEKNVQIVVVTKTAPLDAVKDVIRLGCTELGENRTQHLKQIADEIDAFLKENADDPAVPDKVHWHMIGHLQRNKVKPTLKICRMIHSVDTLRLAEEINADRKSVV